jgi:D-threo-aldose 1-dehydrogenase
MLASARRMAALCEEQDLEMPHAALRFPFRHPAVLSVVCGMRTPEEVEADLSWALTDVPAQLWAELDAQSHGVIRS